MRRAFVVAMVLVGSLALIDARPPAPLQLRDLRAIVQFSSVQISPDGKLVVAVRTRAEFKQDAYVSDLVLINVVTRRLRPLTEDRAVVASPSWSPSGNAIAFVTLDARKEPQVFVLRMHGGEAHRATDAEAGVSTYTWSPDGRRLAYVTSDVSPDTKKIKAHNDAFLITEQPFTAHGAVLPSHIWIVATDAGKAIRLTRGTWSVAPGSRLDWRADGRAIAFTWNTDGSADFVGRERAAFVEPSSGKVHFLGPMGSSGAAYDSAGRTVTFLAPNRIAALQNDLIVSDAEGGRERDLSAKLDRSATNPVFDAAGEVLFTAGDGTHGRGYRAFSDGVVTTLPLGNVDVTEVAFSTARNDTVAFAGATEVDPSEVYAWSEQTNRLVRLTAANGFLATHPMGTRRTISWTSEDGIPLDGVVTVPAGIVGSRKYPLVLYIHGGPTAASNTAFDFIGLPELMAARGWIVLEPNYRGSNSLGARGIAAAMGHPASMAGPDILAALAIVERHYPVDRTRIGVSGWSAGGMLTSWLIEHDLRWNAAFEGAPLNAFVTVATLGDIDNYANMLLQGDPWHDDAAMARAVAESPITRADRIKTPVMIVSDAGDQRVPSPAAYEFYHALRAAGAPVTFVIYPSDGHFPTDPRHVEEITRDWLEWFAQHFNGHKPQK
jgi:dipeptidyl aminopeptidase/acylaminoacyl peptidase